MAVAAVAFVALAVGGAFALGLFAGEPTALDQVPDEADAVASVDPAVVDDPATRELGTAALAAAGIEVPGIGTPDAATVVTLAELRTGLSTAAVHEAVLFGRYDGSGRLDSDYVGAVVHANWSTESLVGALEGTTGVEYDQGAIDDVALYRPPDDAVVGAGGVSTRPPTVAVLANGEFAIGTEAAVADAVAVAGGDAEALDGALRRTYVATEEGLVTAAIDVSPEWIAEFDARTQGLTRLGSVDVIAGAYDATEQAHRLRLRLGTNGTEAARDVTAFTRGGLPVVASRLDDETAASLLTDVAVEREGTDATLRVETTVDDLREIAAHFGLGGA